MKEIMLTIGFDNFKQNYKIPVTSRVHACEEVNKKICSLPDAKWASISYKEGGVVKKIRKGF